MVHILTKETSSGLMPTTFSYKTAVKCATTANGTLATAYAAGETVDGVTLVTGDRILIKDQSAAKENGVYTVNATGAPTRATDMNAATMFPGAVVAVQEGTTNADSGWVCTADAGIVLETSDIVWAIFGGLKAGTNLVITADVIGIDPSGFTASQLVRLNSGGTALEAAGATALGTNQSSWTVDLDATAGKIKILTVGGGTDNTLTISNQVLSGDVTITLPNATGTLATLAGTEALTNKTKVAIATQSAAYNDSALQVGVYGTPIADTLLVDNILVSFNNSSGVNKTAADTSSMTLYVGNRTTAAVTNNKIQGILSSLTIAHNVYDAYAGQFHIAITDDMATQAGNANLVGLACKANIADGKTATGNVSALYVVLDSGTGDTATGSYDMIRMENNATNCDAAIAFGSPANMASLFSMSVAGCVTADTGSPAATTTHKIKINIGGADGYIPVYADY